MAIMTINLVGISKRKRILKLTKSNGNLILQVFLKWANVQKLP